MPPTDKNERAIDHRFAPAAVMAVSIAQEMGRRDIGEEIAAQLLNLPSAPSAERAQEPVAWRREWEGDDSDIGMWVHADSPDERDEPLDRWQPLYAAPVVAPSSALPQEDRTRIADANLNALLTYTGGFYSVAMEHGMKRGETANAIAHVESAARALHRLAVTPNSATSPTNSEMQAVWDMLLLDGNCSKPDLQGAAKLRQLLDDLITARSAGPHCVVTDAQCDRGCDGALKCARLARSEGTVTNTPEGLKRG